MTEDIEPTRRVDAAADHLVALPAGTLLGRYRLQDVLGQGGFGITYRATDTELARLVAIKEYLPSDVAVRVDGTTVKARSRNDEESFAWGLSRFLDEARALARFRAGPSIVQVYDYVQANGTAYMVMELIEGASLAETYRRAGTLDEEKLKGLAFNLLNGLDYVHAAGFLHRDIKPANILLRSDGEPVLIDFGAARQALGEKSRSITGIYTPGYAPFEQYMSEGKQGPWTDIYALGATLYQGITGRAPPQATDRMLQDAMVPAARAGAGRYSNAFLDAVDRALAVHPKDRPQTVAQWRAMIAGQKPALTARGRRWRLAVLAAGAVALVGASVGATMLFLPGRPGSETDNLQLELKAAEERARRLAEEARKATEEARDRAERLAIAAGEAEKRAIAQAERQRAAEEQAKRRREEEERQRLAEIERLKAEEAARLQAVIDAKRREEEAKRMADVEARRRAEDEARKLIEQETERLRLAQEKADEQRRAAEEARRQAEAELAESRRQAEAAQKEAELRQRQAEQAKEAAEQEAKRLAAAEAKRQAEEEARKKAEADAKVKAEAEAKKKADEEAKKKADAEAAKKKAEEDAAKKKADAEAAKKKAEEDAAKKKTEDEAKKKADEERRATRRPVGGQELRTIMLSYSFERLEAGKINQITYRADGVVVTERDYVELDRGKWRVTDQGYCTAWQKAREGKEFCFDMEIQNGVLFFAGTSNNFGKPIKRLANDNPRAQDPPPQPPAPAPAPAPQQQAAAAPDADADAFLKRFGPDIAKQLVAYERGASARPLGAPKLLGYAVVEVQGPSVVVSAEILWSEGGSVQTPLSRRYRITVGGFPAGPAKVERVVLVTTPAGQQQAASFTYAGQWRWTFSCPNGFSFESERSEAINAPSFSWTLQGTRPGTAAGQINGNTMEFSLNYRGNDGFLYEAQFSLTGDGSGSFRGAGRVTTVGGGLGGATVTGRVLINCPITITKTNQ